MQIKEILKVTLLTILVVSWVVICNMNFIVIRSLIGLFMSVYWLFYILITYFFIYIFFYLMIIFYLFKNKIIRLNYIFVLFFTIAFYLSAEFFTAKNERIDSIIRSILIILGCSGFIYYFFKKWIYEEK